MRKSALFLILAVSFMFADSGGPDAFGYLWKDSREPGGPAFDWIEIKDTGRRLSISSIDDGEETITMDRAFEFYGVPQSTITVGSNGVMSFSSTTYLPLSVSGLPYADSYNNLACPMVMDLAPHNSTESGSGIYFQEFDDMAVIEWYEIREYSSGPYQSFQVVLLFGSKTIYFNYLKTNLPSTRRAHVGIENAEGTIGLLCGVWGASDDPDFLQDSLTIRMRATPVASAPYFNDLSAPDDLQLSDSEGWEWGRPTVGPSGGHTGMNCVGTALDDNYDADADWPLIFPDIDLGAAELPILDFWHWYSTEDGTDGGIVEISTNDGSTWRVLEPEGGYPTTMSGGPLAGLDAFSGSSDGWEYVSFDLSEYLGLQMKFRTRLASNSSVADAGWYIDDIGLHEQYGVIRGTIDLAYTDVDAGVEVTLEPDGRSLFTDMDGSFMFDSVKVSDTYTIQLMREGFLADSISAVEVMRLDTTEVYRIMSPRLYFSDFSTNNGGWIADPPVDGWEWGEPAPGLSPGAPHSDSLCCGTDLDGNYDTGCHWFLEQEIFIGEIERPSLRFWSWYMFSGEFAGQLFDGGNVKVSADSGATWHIVYPRSYFGIEYDGVISSHNEHMAGQPAFGGSDNGNFWQALTFDLMPFQENLMLQVRFEIGADEMGESRGWYIDDIQVFDDYEGIDEAELSDLPEKLAISAYPNPFNSTAHISCEIPTGLDQDPSLTIYDLSGRALMSMNPGREPGMHNVAFVPQDGSPSGVYLAVLRAGDTKAETRLLFVK